MSEIVLRGIRKSFGSATVIKQFDLTIRDGERLVFVGPSGCGKSTLLRMICGIEDISAGQILIDGVDVTALPAARRGLAMVFQNYALYPHMTVRDNIGFSLRVAGVHRRIAAPRVEEVARSLRLEPLLDRYPRELSGGQRQRVAIGRAIVRKPKAFLFDEPLSNLDAALRAEMRVEIAQLHRTLGTTMIYVTHDQTEAMTLADRIVILNKSRIEQVGSPQELYERPANSFVAEFLGSPRINMLPVSARSDGRMELSTGAILDLKAPEGVTTIGVRPDNLRVVDRSGNLVGKVVNVEFFGNESLVYADCGTGSNILFKMPGRATYSIGDPCALVFAAEHVLAFDGDGSALRLRRQHGGSTS